MENVVTKSIRMAVAYVVEMDGCSCQDAEFFVRKTMREKFPILYDSCGSKFIFGLTRLYEDGEINSHSLELMINGTIKFIIDNGYTQEFDIDLNGDSAQSLINRFQKDRQDLILSEKAEIERMKYKINRSYRIVPIYGFENAQLYCHSNDWCTGTSLPSFNDCTKDGLVSFYYCLKDGYENVPRKEGPDFPFDDYGLSMIAVSVDEKGYLNSCTLRWNHCGLYNDYAMNASQLSRLLGVNFYEAFKPFPCS